MKLTTSALKNITFLALGILVTMFLFIHSAFYTFPPDFSCIPPVQLMDIFTILLGGFFVWFALTAVTNVIELEIHEDIIDEEDQ